MKTKRLGTIKWRRMVEGRDWQDNYYVCCHSVKCPGPSWEPVGLRFRQQKARYEPDKPKWMYDEQGKLVPYRAPKVVEKSVVDIKKKPSCPECQGSGSTQDGGMFSQHETCYRCKGTGLKSMTAIRAHVKKIELAELARLKKKYPKD